MLSDDIRFVLKGESARKAKEKGDRIYFRCPRHEDDTPSAWMGGGAWGCFTCGFEESITTLAEEIGVTKSGGSANYTVGDYAAEKSFPLQRLQDWGVTDAIYDGRHVMAIPYFGLDGEQLRRRFRSGSGKWWEGKNLPIYLYGLDRLADLGEGSAILVVEGESDCHAAWLHGFNAIGAPGATTWKSEWSEHIKGLDAYVWEEPDQGGPELVRRVAQDIPDAKVIAASDADAKDLADLHRKRGNGFDQALRELMARASKVGTPRPPVVFDVLLSDRVEALIESKSAPVDAAPTPWPSWNQACRGAGGRQGLARGWHVIGAAKTGVGKSIMALNLACAAVKAGERVCFVSLEMAQEEVETRMLAIVSQQPIRMLEQGSYFDASALRRAGRRMAELHERTGGCFWTNRQPVHRLPDVLDSMKFNHEVRGCRYFIVDYLQLAGNPLKPETIVTVSNAIRRLTKDLRVVTVGLSQFNRLTSVSKDRPTKEGLQGGSALENDSDQVFLVDHSRIEKVPSANGYDMFVLLDKNRHGPLCEIPIFFDSSRTLGMWEREVNGDMLGAQEAA